MSSKLAWATWQDPGEGLETGRKGHGIGGRGGKGGRD